MTLFERLPVERVVGEGEITELLPAEIDAVLEVGYLTIACDSELRDEELVGLGRVLSKLGGGKAHPGAYLLAETMERFSAYLERDGFDGRLETCAAALSRKSARDIAYKLACALALVDRDLGDREFELDLSLIAALGLTQDEADALAHEVHAALQ